MMRHPVLAVPSAHPYVPCGLSSGGTATPQQSPRIDSGAVRYAPRPLDIDSPVSASLGATIEVHGSPSARRHRPCLFPVVSE
jgi:hypothetical protein